ncbi:MAG: hypothetical protein ABIK53_05030, partial [bacterium]
MNIHSFLLKIMMKRKILNLFWIYLLLIILFSYSVKAENLLKNPGFEEVDTSSNPLNWSLHKFTADNYLKLDRKTYTILPIGKSNVVKAFRREGRNWSSLSQGEIKVEGDTFYIFSMRHIESKGFTHDLFVAVREYDQDSKHLEKGYGGMDYLSLTVPASSIWSTWTKGFKTQAKTTTMSIYIYPIGAGTAWFDDFSLVRHEGSVAELEEKLQTYYQEDFSKKGNWETKEVIFTPTTEGARITTLKSYGYLKGYIPYDKLHPYLQIKINKVEKDTKWMLVSLSKGMERISLPSDKIGLFTYDIGKIPGLPEEGQFLLAIYVLGEEKNISIEGIRTISREVADTNKWKAKRITALKIGFVAESTDINNWKNNYPIIKIKNNTCIRVGNNPTNCWARLDSPIISLDLDKYPWLTISLKHNTKEKYGWSLALDNKIPLSVKQYTNKSGVITYNLREKTNWKGKRSFFLSLYVVGEGKYVDINWIKLANRPIEAAYELTGREAKKGYLLYAKPPFSINLPTTLPQKDEVNKKVSIFASPNEYEPASFLIYTTGDLKNVKVSLNSDLREGKNKISKNNIDIRLLKRWYQAGRGERVGETVFVPELLLKNDRLITSDHIKQRNILNFKGRPEDSSVLLPFDIPAYTNKQIWMIVKVPS